jgi:hypothetical protein
LSEAIDGAGGGSVEVGLSTGTKVSTAVSDATGVSSETGVSEATGVSEETGVSLGGGVSVAVGVSKDSCAPAGMASPDNIPTTRITKDITESFERLAYMVTSTSSDLLRSPRSKRLEIDSPRRFAPQRRGTGECDDEEYRERNPKRT